MRWRGVLWVLGLLGLVAVGAVRLRPARPAGARSEAARPSSPLPTAGGTATPRFAPLGQPGVADRRIAGQVMHAGQPVANATVRLTTEELGVGEWDLDETQTDGEGRFDLGARPVRLTVERNGASLTFEVPPEGTPSPQR